MINKYLTFIVFILLISFGSNAQSNFNSAHFRPLAFSLNASVDARFPALMLKPELNMKLLKGYIEFGGQYHIQLQAMQDWDKEIGDRNKALVGLGFDLPYEGNEFYIGGNFYRSYNTDATVSWGGGGFGPISYIRFEPGERATLAGAHMGLGSFRSKTPIYDQGFNLKDDRGNTYSAAFDPNLVGESYNFETYTNFVVNYFFVGLHINSCARPDRSSNGAWGGRTVRTYVDLILPSKFEVGKMYSELTSVEYEAVPFEGDSWTKMGYRFGLKTTGSGLFSINMGFEFGRMPSVGTDLFGPPNVGGRSLFLSMHLGVNIWPLLKPLEID